MTQRTRANGDIYERRGRQWRLIYKAPKRPGKADPRSMETSIMRDMLEGAGGVHSVTAGPT